jgi:hypothetical protein
MRWIGLTVVLVLAVSLFAPLAAEAQKTVKRLLQPPP